VLNAVNLRVNPKGQWVKPINVMPTLKSRTKWPVGGFQILLPEIGMKAPITGSFTEVVNAFAKIVAKNPSLAQKQGWPTTREAQENWLDEREAQRMIAGGYFGFVELEGQPPPYMGGASRNIGGGHVAAVGDAAMTGLAVYRELFTGKSKPVAREVAEQRAAICAGCPQNNTKRTFRERFVAYVAKGLTELVGIMRDMEFVTSHDKQLGTCEACECPLFAKVYTELPTIERNMKPAQRAKLDPRCWITHETPTV